MADTKERPLTVLEQQIVEALAELRGARLDYDERTVAYAERRLDLLFERRAKG